MSTIKRLRILLIEDNPGDAGIVQEYLLESQSHSFQVKLCVRISEALKYLESEKDIDIILSDVGLPDTAGIGTFRKLHNAAVDTPLVFMTGTIPDEEAAIQALKEGAQDYLVKGQFTSDLLIRSIRYAIERKKSDIEKGNLIKKEQKARKQLEIKKNKLELEIVERIKLEKQKDEFIGIASHELKTPITSIKAYAQILALRFRTLEDVRSIEMIGKMEAQIDKLSLLIKDLLDVTKVRGGELQFNNTHFDFNDLIEEVVEEMQRITAKHTITKELGEKITVYGDRDRLGQVMVNFLSNAIKYSSNADKILVKTNADKDVTLSVQDFGVGISTEDQKKVFERFYRVAGQETYPGLGLGLYIASEIIKRQGGKIWVESKEGEGSIFSFCIPITSIIKHETLTIDSKTFIKIHE